MRLTTHNFRTANDRDSFPEASAVQGTILSKPLWTPRAGRRWPFHSPRGTGRSAVGDPRAAVRTAVEN